MEIKIKATAVTPLCQISGVEETMIDGSKVSYTAIQKMPMYVPIGDEKVFVKLPIYTANGFRGALRRVSTRILYDKAIEKDISLGKNAIVIGKSFHAQNAGGNVSYTNCPIGKEREIREANPVVSYLGVSLAVSGKVSVSPLFPKEKDPDGNLVYPIAKSKNDNGGYYAKCSSIKVQYKVDDMERRSENSKIFTFQTLEEWDEVVKNSRENKDVENLNASHVISTEEVHAGTDFYGSIVSTDKLTDIEKGLLISSLIKLVKKQLGAIGSHGRGKMNYELTFGKSVIRSKWNDFLSNASVSVSLDDDASKCVAAFEEWLENIDEKNIQISEMLDRINEK
ncbi:hypothetical protein [Sulfurimonas indica]|uniref:hypothetical protein n=1 Tax=Sulfurimonas TaxID=202746 RepID=UPI001265A7E1|nr:hypothetical protein [Sulfurimonas indica]